MVPQTTTLTNWAIATVLKWCKITVFWIIWKNIFTFSYVHVFISWVGAWKWGYYHMCYFLWDGIGHWYVHMFKCCVSLRSPLCSYPGLLPENEVFTAVLNFFAKGCPINEPITKRCENMNIETCPASLTIWTYFPNMNMFPQHEHIPLVTHKIRLFFFYLCTRNGCLKAYNQQTTIFAHGRPTLLRADRKPRQFWGYLSDRYPGPGCPAFGFFDGATQKAQ